MIKGDTIQLIPATPEDRLTAYQWLCQSDTTPYHMGPPHFPNHPVLTWEEFCQDYTEYYFDGSEPAKGRCFVIISQDTPVGIISYSCFHLKQHKAELDIWMNSLQNCGQGRGPDAIRTLCSYLHETLGISDFIIRPSARNPRAVKAYEKAGFVKINQAKKEETLHEFLLDQYYSLYGPGDYGSGDDVVLIKSLQPAPR
ncbi:MAG: GNAT family N-acetyltransferase [Clostridia bacterium]|nr:GNAT family N-acetyltransferase [Clostridia bacterium]